MPGWMTTIDTVRPPTAFVLGALLAGLNPKNLLLAVAGATTIAQTGIPGGQQALAYAVFTVIGSIGVAAPLAVYVVAGDSAPETLERLKDWLAHNNAVITSVLCLIIGIKLIGDAVTVLTS